MQLFKECRDGQLLDVGDRILTYGSESWIGGQVKGRFYLDQKFMSIAQEVIRTTSNYVFTEDGRKWPRRYSKGSRRSTWAFSVK